jgi:hypothetical protein
VPEAVCFPGVLESRPGLTALPLAEKHGMVWVLPTAAADGSPDLDIDPFLDGLKSDLEFWKLNGYHLHARHVHYEAMNWKLLIDTFLEGYHFGFLHGESLRGILKPNICNFRAFGPNATRLRARQDRPAPREAGKRMGPDVEFHHRLFNVRKHYLLARRPHGGLPRVSGRWTSRSRGDGNLALYPEASRDRGREAALDANLALAIKVITTEDFPAGRSMQLGFGSGAQSHVIYGRNEPALTHYHRSIRRALSLADDA